MADVDRLIHDYLKVDVVVRQLVLHLRHGFLEAVDDFQGAGPLLAVDGDVDLAPAVDTDHVRLNQAGITRVGHVFQENGVAALRLHRDVAHAVDQLVHRIGVEGVVGLAEFRITGRQEDVVVVDAAHQVERRQVPRLHASRGSCKRGRSAAGRHRRPARWLPGRP